MKCLSKEEDIDIHILHSTNKKKLMASVTKDDELSSFDVPEIDRHTSSQTLYKIVLQITPKELTENSYQLVYWKRYNDIRKLYEVLQRYHQAIYRPGKFPDFTAPSRFMERFDSAIAEERRVATKNFLNYVLQHRYLRTHEAYINFFQKGEKVLLPDVQTAALQPEIVTPQPEISNNNNNNTSPLITSTEPIIETNKNEELLLNTDEEEQIEQVTNRCAKILDDLNDLQFEQQVEINKEKEEFNLIKQEVDEAANLLSLPLATTIQNHDSS